MANFGPVQVPSQLSNLTTFPELVRFVSSFAGQMANQFNGMIGTKAVWGVVGSSGVIEFGSGNFGATGLTFGLYQVFFRESFSIRPAVTVSVEDQRGLFCFPASVTTDGFTVSTADGTLAPLPGRFSFIAMGGR